MKADISTDSPIWLALNMSKVANNEESFALMGYSGRLSSRGKDMPAGPNL